MQLADGKTITDSKSILQESRDFYQRLYNSSSTKSNSIQDEIFLENVPKLSEEEKKSCEELLTIEECSNIVSSLQNNKSPGNDGFTGEFYKAFWPIVGGLVVDSFNESYKKGKLTNSQRQAVITLLVKKDKNRAFLRNWRPISLLNIDYKIASKAIAQRIQKVLPSIIHSDQCGYVSNRQIGDAVRTIADVTEYTKKHDLHGLMIFIDFEKAFDSLNWNYMHKCLDAFNFGPTLTSWVHVFYNDISSCIMNGGFTSGHFNVTNGVSRHTYIF